MNKQFALIVLMAISLFISGIDISAAPKTHVAPTKISAPIAALSPTPSPLLSLSTTVAKDAPRRVVVLPPGFENQKVIIEDSDEYKAMLAKSKNLEAQIANENKEAGLFKDSVDRLLIEKEAENRRMAAELAVEKAKNKRFSLFKWIAGIFGFGSFLIPIALIALCIFVPELIPTIIGIFIKIIKVIGSIFGRTFSGLETAVETIHHQTNGSKTPTTNPS